VNTFDYLCLLVGTNPLPNLVVAEYFLKNKLLAKEIFLIHSEMTPFHNGTLQEAERLNDIISEKYPSIKVNKVSISNINQAKIIKREVKEKIIERIPIKSSIHLNYTGGTKAMGIHVYNTFKDAQKFKASYSYLDAREYMIVDDDNGKITDDLRDSVHITFDKMITLHGFKRANQDPDTSAFINTIEMFKKFINENRIEEFYKSYKREIFLDKRGNLASRFNDLKNNFQKNNINNTVTNGIFLEIIKTLPEEVRLFDDEGNFQSPKDENIGKSLRYIDGAWFEDYVYSILKNNMPDKYIQKNWEIKKPEWSNQKFEIDVLVINGYQLIGISCTTSDRKSICKSKGFEMLLRCRQIGGDEAKAVLLTKIKKDKAEELQNELIADTAGYQNIVVLSKEDWGENLLCRKIKEFIN